MSIKKLEQATGDREQGSTAGFQTEWRGRWCECSEGEPGGPIWGHRGDLRTGHLGTQQPCSGSSPCQRTRVGEARGPGRFWGHSCTWRKGLQGTGRTLESILRIWAEMWLHQTRLLEKSLPTKIDINGQGRPPGYLSEDDNNQRWGHHVGLEGWGPARFADVRLEGRRTERRRPSLPGLCTRWGMAGTCTGVRDAQREGTGVGWMEGLS